MTPSMVNQYLGRSGKRSRGFPTPRTEPTLNLGRGRLLRHRLDARPNAVIQLDRMCNTMNCYGDSKRKLQYRSTNTWRAASVYLSPLQRRLREIPKYFHDVGFTKTLIQIWYRTTSLMPHSTNMAISKPVFARFSFCRTSPRYSHPWISNMNHIIGMLGNLPQCFQR